MEEIIPYGRGRTALGKIKILHTSDWHLGRALYGRKRYEEFEAFLNWLAETIQQHEVDVLLVAGDIFDTSAPSNRAQELYYRFLCRVAASPCRHVVVIGGNHDSPSFLNAPRELLKFLDIHVIGSATENPEDEVHVLRDSQGTPQLIVCAVPYLRDRDIRVAEAGESVEDKERKMVEGICDHYAAVAAHAEKERSSLGPEIPIIAMGHLFTAGGQTLDGDGVRELYVGSLAHVAAGIFPDCFDYLALGHLHVPQKVSGSESRRYSGAPLAMGFGEAGQEKSVCLTEFCGRTPSVQMVPVPVFQRLERIRGAWEKISAELLKLSSAGSDAWLEIVYDGEDLIGDLRERLDAAVDGTGMEILRVKNNRLIDRALKRGDEDETLDDLNATEVFARCLTFHSIPMDQQPELLHTYEETLALVLNEDLNAE